MPTGTNEGKAVVNLSSADFFSGQDHATNRVPTSGAKGITLHASDKFGGVHFEDPLFLDGWRFVENNVVTGQQIINGLGKILQSRSASEITSSAEAGMVEDTGFFHEILFGDKRLVFRRR